MTAITAWLDAAQARADAATPSPWVRYPNPTSVAYIKQSPRDGSIIGGAPVAEASPANAEFITAARTDLPAALAALRAVLDLVEPMHPDDVVSEADRAVERHEARIRAAIASALGVSEP